MLVVSQELYFELLVSQDGYEYGQIVMTVGDGKTFDLSLNEEGGANRN
jgi:hypothetical protein